MVRAVDDRRISSDRKIETTACCCTRLSLFFFQAEDGIRDGTVTGVQTCALPISIRIVRVDEDRRDLLAVAQPEMPPGGAAVRRPVDPVAHRQIGPLQSFATPDVEIGRASCRERV